MINPILTLVESIYSVEDAEQVYEKEVVYDSRKLGQFNRIRINFLIHTNMSGFYCNGFLKIHIFNNSICPY